MGARYMCVYEDRRWMEEVVPTLGGLVGNAFVHGMMTYAGFVDALKARIRVIRPGIVVGGGLEAYAKRCIEQYLMPHQDPDDLQLLWDVMEGGDLVFAGLLYINVAYPSMVLLASTRHLMNLALRDTIVLDRAFPRNDTNPLHLSNETSELGVIFGKWMYEGYGNLRSVMDTFQHGSYLSRHLVHAVLRTAATPANRYMLLYLHLTAIVCVAERGRPGERPAFIVDSIVAGELVLRRYKARVDGQVVCANAPTTPAIITSEYMRYCDMLAASAAVLAAMVPHVPHVWHYLWLFCPTVLTVDVSMQGENGATWVETRQVSWMAQQMVDIAFVAGGRAQPHWTRHAHQYGARMIEGQWPDLPGIPEANASVFPSERDLNSLSARRRRYFMPVAERPVIRVSPWLETIIAVYLMAKTRLWREGLLNPGPEIHTAVEEDTLENLTTLDNSMRPF